MRKIFTGVWGTFEFLDDFCATIETLRLYGFDQLTTHTPCPRKEIDKALGDKQSKTSFAALFGMLCGFCCAVVMIMLIAFEWGIPLAGKPILSIPLMIPVVFEISLFGTILFLILSILLFVTIDSRRHHTPASTLYKDYDRFMKDRFGVVIPCKQEEFESVLSILKQYHAEEIHCENRHSVSDPSNPIDHSHIDNDQSGTSAPAPNNE